MTAILTIAGTSYTFEEPSYDQTNTIDERQRLKVIVIDYSGTAHFLKGQQVVVTDPSLGIIFSGYLYTSKELNLYPSGIIRHEIDCIDQHYLVDKRTYTHLYSTPAKAGKIVVDQAQLLISEGISQNFANRFDNLSTDFNQGTLANTVGALSTGDGDLELAPSGTTLVYTENTTAQFATGSLTNCVAANNTLIPTSTNVLKIVATMSFAGPITASTHVKIWAGSITCTTTTNFIYDIFIDPSSPQITCSLNLTFSDGSTFFDTYGIPDSSDYQNLYPLATVDLAGFANIGWYHRSFKLVKHAGKVISNVTVVIAGATPGTYTAYIRNANTTFPSATIFNGTLNVNPPQQLENYGYSAATVSIVPSYDLYSATQPLYGATSYRTTSAISVNQVHLLQSSYITWQAAISTNIILVVQYSLDNNYFISCTNNAPLPNLPSGTDLTGQFLYIQYLFFAVPGGNVELAPVVRSLTLTLNTSYVATKSDTSYIVDTQTGWNAGTLNNLIANSNNELTLNGTIANWLNRGPATTGFTTYSYGNFNAGSHAGFFLNIPEPGEYHVRFDTIPQLANFTAELDIQVPATGMSEALLYRTTGWQNNNNSFGYALSLSTGVLLLGHGTNSGSGGGSFTTIANPSVTTTTGTWYRIKVIANGTNHQCFLNDIRLINATDSFYTGSGYFGLQIYDGNTSGNLTGGYVNNFGSVTVLSGTWISPSTSLTTVGTYGTSVISWQDDSISYNGGTNTTILVEASYNGGSTYAACTNGAVLPGLTLGQSLAGVNLLIRITLSSTTATSLTAVTNLVIRVIGQYSTSGTRSTVPLGNDYLTIVRTVASGWGNAADSQAWSQVGTATTSVGSGEALIANTTGDVHMVLGSQTGTDLDATDRVTISASTISPGLELRYTDANNYYRLSITTTSITIIKRALSINTIIATLPATYAINTEYRMRFRVVGSGPVVLSGIVWLDGIVEPRDVYGNPVWTIGGTD